VKICASYILVSNTASVAEVIRSSLWLSWVLINPHNAAVRYPSSLQIRYVLPQVMITAEWIHWVGFCQCRSGESLTQLANDGRFGLSVNGGLVADWSHGRLASAGWVSQAYFAPIVPIVIWTHRDMISTIMRCHTYSGMFPLATIFDLLIGNII